MAKVLEQGPVLILTFSAQQLMMVRNAKGEIVEGGEVSPSKLLCMSHTSGAQGRGRGGERTGFVLVLYNRLWKQECMYVYFVALHCNTG